MTTAARPRRRNRRGEGELLRAEILAAAKDLLAETGDEDAVSVRAVAERVGVTTPSIYLHFSDKAALIAAVCEDVFADLDRVMEQAAAEHPDDPFESLRARGLAYARFALDNPEHYRIVLMTPPRKGHPDFGADDLVGSTTFHHLVDAVTGCQSAGLFDPSADPALLATALWAATHGAVSLALAKPAIAVDDALALCDLVVSASGLGLAVVGRLPDDEDAAHAAIGAMLGTLHP